MTEIPLKIRLNIWEQRDDPSRTMILYDWQTPFEGSATSNRKWRVFFTFLAYNPLVPPYPDGTQLFRAQHKTIYPYELVDVYAILDVYNVDDPGTYFVAYTANIEGTTKLPFANIHVYVEQGEKIKE
jgi:hypothetical protein